MKPRLHPRYYRPNKTSTLDLILRLLFVLAAWSILFLILK